MIKSGDEMRAAAREFIAALAASPRGATVLALSGDLGAGKTTFVQGLAAALGVTEKVTSPTFILEKIYPLSDQKWERLVHIDAYRLDGEYQLEALAWSETAADPGALIALEWPERIPGAIPESAIRLRFEIQGDGRIITSDGHENGKKSTEKSEEGRG